VDKVRQLITDLTGGPCPDSATDGDVKPRETSLVEKAPQYAFGEFGGRYIPETLVQAHDELEKAYNEAIADPAFIAEVARYRKEYIGGPTMTYHAKRLTELCGGAQIWLKREELAHTGAHKINNAIGQVCARHRQARLASVPRSAPLHARKISSDVRSKVSTNCATDARANT
jgi:tryptophan synthase